MDIPRLHTRPFQISLTLAAAITLYLAFAPGDDSAGDLLDDKVNHFLAFTTLSLLADFSFPRQRFGALKVVPLLAFGVFIEVVQYFLPYREASWYDMAADGVGIAAYGLLCPWLRRLPWIRFRWQT